MKIVVSILSLFMAGHVSFAECVDSNGRDIFFEPAVFQQLIGEMPSCEKAAALAEDCAYGSQLDTSTAGIAWDVCLKEFNQSAQIQDEVLLTNMVTRCDERYQDEEGSLYLSATAYCRLNALAWLNRLVRRN